MPLQYNYHGRGGDMKKHFKELSCVEPCKSCLGINLKNKTVKVGSRGNVKSKIMIVGESPGRNEDVKNKPFVGKAGKLLWNILKGLGIDNPDEFFFTTNITRCRPPLKNGKDFEPPTKMIKSCNVFLQEELKKVNPNLVILLGNTPLKVFSGIKGILKVRGMESWSEKYNVKYIATVHPSYCLRRIEAEEYLRIDLEKALRVCDSKKISKDNSIVKYYSCYDFENPKDLSVLKKVYKIIKNKNIIAFDIETNTLYPKLKGARILCISFSWGFGKSAVIPLDHDKIHPSYPVEEVKNIVKKILVDSEIKKIAHNAKFDMGFIQGVLGYRVKGFFFDTMIAHYLLDENGKHGLKSLASDFTSMGNYEFEIKNKLKELNKKDDGFGNYGNVDLNTLFEYSLKDSDATFRLYELFKVKIDKDDGLKYLMNELYKYLPEILYTMELNGIKISLKYLDRYENRLKNKIDKVYGKVRLLEEVKRFERSLNIKYKTDKKINETFEIELEEGDKGYRKINLNSPKQLSDLLFKVCKIKSVQTTDSGGDSTGAKVLERLKNEHELVPLIQEHRKAEKIITTYTRKYRDLVYPDGKLRGQFNIIGTVTGRFSSDNPNLQNTLRDKDFKRIFRPSKDWLVEADYSQIEFRLMAALSGDKKMIRAYKKGEDLHAITASGLFNVPLDKVTSEQRFWGKQINFTINYGAGEWNIAQQLNIPIAKARKFRKRYYKTFPKLKDYQNKQYRLAEKKGYVKNVFGRYRRLPSIWSRDDREVIDTKLKASNAPIQGTAADITSLALIKIYQAMKKEGYKSLIVATIHDSILFDVVDAELNGLIKLVKLIMEGFEFDFMGEVPLEVGVKKGKTWGTMEEIKF